MNKKTLLMLFFAIISLKIQAQYWQQHIDYKMNINVDVKKFTYDAEQIITYTNHSPDTLKNVYYHLFFNAFQPNSEMDLRLQTITDPDKRMVTNIGTKENPIYKSRISDLKENQTGKIEILSLKQNDQKVDYQVFGTILKVKLHTPILPNEKAVFKMDYTAQIPEMIRRSGRNSKDGVALSMAQWYPKMVEYDHQGWHTHQYIMREFHGVWGDFDVKITIDKKYIVAGTGVLQTENAKNNLPKNKKTWHFKAKNIHDFSWVADPDFQHDIVKTSDGKTLQFFYKNQNENWKKLQEPLTRVFDFFQQKIGIYPWETYSFIQAGDGGMEYAMCTFLAGSANYEQLLGTAIHELGHAWFQHIFASNEAIYPWFDEGLTSYIEDWAKSEVIKNEPNNVSAWEEAYQSYFELVKRDLQEVPTTHADRYDKNVTYSITSYTKGTVFVSQLGYIIGQENLQKTFKRFYHDFAMKHCSPLDFIRTAERVSGMQLYWYLNEFMETTHTIDYAIDKVEASGEKTKITLKRLGRMPMPVDLLIIPNGKKPFSMHIPTGLTFGEKPNPFKNMERVVLPWWGWANPSYSFEIDLPLSQIKSVSIDPQEISADINRTNNVYP